MSQQEPHDTRGQGKVKTALVLAGIALFFFIAIIINKS